MANRVLDEWTGPDASGFYEHFQLTKGRGDEKLYRLVESLEQGIVTERWLEIRVLGSKWCIVEDTDEAYYILRDRLAEMIIESKKGEIK